MPPSFQKKGCTRQREESERYEERRLDYATGLTMVEATRAKHAKMKWRLLWQD